MTPTENPLFSAFTAPGALPGNRPRPERNQPNSADPSSEHILILLSRHAWLTSKHSLALILLFVSLVLMVLSIRNKTLTYDETGHFDYGVNALKGQPARKYPNWNSKMPFTALNALPYGVGRLGQSLGVWRNPPTFLLDRTTGRYVTICFSLILGWYVYKWSDQLYGRIGGLLSLVLYVLCPNIIAHSRLVTTDLYTAGMITIATYYLWRYANSRTARNALLSAVTLSLSQLAKYTCVFLYPIFIIIFIGIILTHFSRSPNRRFSTENVKPLFTHLALLGVASIAVVNLGFAFHETLTPLKNYSFKSELLKSVQAVPLLRAIPIPLPYPYLDGLDQVRYAERQGYSFGNLYLLGELRRPDESGARPFSTYYIFAFALKVPLATQIFLAFAIGGYIFSRQKHNFILNEWFLLAPAAFLFLYFNLLFRAQIGIRFILPILPLLFVFCGSFVKTWGRLNKARIVLVVSLLIYLICSVLLFFPHYLSYFNELILDRKQAYKYLADSNLNWGQNEFYLETYLRTHPDARLHPKAPTPGRIVVDVNRLVGIYDPEEFRWLRKSFEPIDHIAYSYLVYEVPEDPRR